MTTATNTTAVIDETVTISQAVPVQHMPTQHMPTQQMPTQPGSATPSTALPGATASVTQHTSTFSITSFVLGIVSIIAGWSFIAPIVGLTLGVIALRRKAPERTLALWGVWLNGVILAFTSLMAFGFIAIAAAGLFGGAIWGF